MAYAGKAMAELEEMLGELEEGVKRKSGSKRKLQWGAVKIAFNGEVLDRLTEKLEGAVGALQFALSWHSA